MKKLTYPTSNGSACHIVNLGIVIRNGVDCYEPNEHELVVNAQQTKNSLNRAGIGADFLNRDVTRFIKDSPLSSCNFWFMRPNCDTTD